MSSPAKYLFLIFISLVSLYSCKQFNHTDVSSKKITNTQPNSCAWHNLRKNFALKDASNHKSVLKHTTSMSNDKIYIKNLVDRSEPYLHYILQKLRENNIPSEFALLPMIESTYDPFAYSDSGPAGLWQMMPGTATGFGVKQNWWYDGRRDLIQSTNAAINYLKQLNKYFDGYWLLVLAAYNSGQGTVKRAIQKNIAAGKNADYWSLDLPNQTQDYVPKLLALTSIIKYPTKYQLKLPEYHSRPYFEIVEIGSQIDLNVAATLSETDIAEIYRLNSGFNRWLTNPSGPHKLALPINKINIFKNNLLKVSDAKHLSLKHKVKKGDSLI